MRLIGVMCTSGNGFSRDILIDRARFIVFLNVIYYTIVLNDPFIIVYFFVYCNGGADAAWGNTCSHSEHRS